MSFDTLLDYYKNAILFIFTSYYEGFGFVLAEAMAAGLPIVCANNSAIPEIVEDAAILVENDSDQIAKTILEMINNVELREKLAKNSILRAENFREKYMAQKHIRVYEELVR